MTNSLLNKMKKYMLSFYLPFLVAAPFAPILGWFEKYVFKDWEFLKFLVVLIAIDTFLSWIYHIFFTKDFSSTGFSKILLKLIVYTALLVLSHVMGNFTINGVPQETFTWFRVLVLTALLIREGVSIVENGGKIYPNAIPLWIRKYMKDFDEHGFARRPGEMSGQ